MTTAYAAMGYSLLDFYYLADVNVEALTFYSNMQSYLAIFLYSKTCHQCFHTVG